MGDAYNFRNVTLYNIYKGLLARCHSFVYFYNFRSYAHSFNTFVHHIRSHSLNPTLFFFIAVRSGLYWGARPRIELGTAVQQPDAPPSELRRTIMSYAAPYTELRRTLLSYTAPSWATPHPPELRRTLLSYAAPFWATPHPRELGHLYFLKFKCFPSHERYMWHIMRQNWLSLI